MSTSTNRTAADDGAHASDQRPPTRLIVALSSSRLPDVSEGQQAIGEQTWRKRCRASRSEFDHRDLPPRAARAECGRIIDRGLDEPYAAFDRRSRAPTPSSAAARVAEAGRLFAEFFEGPARGEKRVPPHTALGEQELFIMRRLAAPSAAPGLSAREADARDDGRGARSVALFEAVLARAVRAPAAAAAGRRRRAAPPFARRCLERGRAARPPTGERRRLPPRDGGGDGAALLSEFDEGAPLRARRAAARCAMLSYKADAQARRCTPPRSGSTRPAARAGTISRSSSPTASADSCRRQRAL